MPQESIAQFRSRFAALAEILAAGAKALPGLNADTIAASAEECGAELAALRADMARAVVPLPDGTKIAGWEYDALVELAKTNEVEEQLVFNGVKQVEGGRIVIADFHALGLSDVRHLEILTSLKDLDLCENRLTGVRPLLKLERLEDLWLDDNPLAGAGQLAGFTRLRILSLCGCEVDDISALAGLTQLEELYLDRNGLTGIGALAGFFRLQTLSLDGNRVSDISVLAGCSELESLMLRRNPLAGAASESLLEELKARGTRVRR